jgi:hypothetical protein
MQYGGESGHALPVSHKAREGAVKKRKERMMKNDDPPITDVLTRSERPLPSFAAHVLTGGYPDEIVKLGTENIRLQRLVAELLVENQRLRQRYCGDRRDAGPSDLSAVPSGDRRDS